MLNWNEPAALVREARSWLDDKVPLPIREGPGEGSTQRDIANRLAELVRESLARGQNLHHPHYVGHQVPAPVPLAALVRTGRYDHEPGDGDLRNGPLGDRG